VNYKYKYSPFFWDASSFYRVPLVLYWILVFLALVYSGFQLSFRSEIKVPVMLLGVLGIGGWFAYSGKLRLSAVFYFVLAAIVTPILGWLFLKLQLPEVAGSPRVEDLANKFYFVIPALVLAGSQKNVLVFWAIAAASAITLPWTAGEGWTEISQAIEGRRSGFGRHIITMGMIYASIMIGLLVFFKRLVFKPKFSWLAFGLWLTVFCFVTFAALASQTRAVYLGLLLVLLIVFIWSLVYQPWRRQLKPGLVLGFLAMLFLAGLIGVQQGFVERTVDRFDREMDAIHALADGDLSKVPRNSMGLRIHFWADAVDWIAERPLTGWGYHGSQMLHEEAGNYFGDRNFLTIHNDLLDIWLSYGFFGVLLFIVFFAWLIRGLYRAWSSGVMPGDFLVFFYLFIIFYLFNGVFISTFFFRDSIYLFNVVMAAAVTFVLKDRLTRYGW